MPSALASPLPLNKSSYDLEHDFAFSAIVLYYCISFALANLEVANAAYILS